MGSRALLGTPAPGHFYSPARGSGLTSSSSLRGSAGTPEAPGCSGPDGLPPPAQVPASSLHSGEGRRGPQQLGRPPFLSLRLRAAQPQKGAQELSLFHSLYRRSGTSNSGFGSITGAASGRHGPRRHFGYCSRRPESDPDPVSLRSSVPWVPQWTGNIPGPTGGRVK
ncbi:hypothetical protein NDU88_005927 [Pleurodeles waltl]|uniref:Uncharacterized protein n=1 Tax=Pleurodeles waltl TaxID=8319 RepID=A0AAV7VN56_PLEWA|nr:hypothetical protein NDU88_005927 [Pleurodeles waltl]